LNIISTQLERA